MIGSLPLSSAHPWSGIANGNFFYPFSGGRVLWGCVIGVEIHAIIIMRFSEITSLRADNFGDLVILYIQYLIFIYSE